MENYIVAKDLSKIYNLGKENEVRALREVSFSLNEGEIAVILGASGAGKTTLLNILGGMDNATSGEYHVGDKDIAKCSSKDLSSFRRLEVGFVFQFYNLMGNLTALENIELAASLTPDSLDPFELLKKVGLEKRANNFPSELSGGEQQRVSIARALVKNPKLLLCDEPTGALDSLTGESVLDLLFSVAKSLKKTVLLVTHNSKIAECGERLLQISDGSLVGDKKIEHPLSPKDIKW